MSEQIFIPANQVSFREFIWGEHRNRTALKAAAIAIVIQFAIFKYFYPFVSFIHGDSFNYIQTASNNWGINTYMIGYPMFLRFLSVFTTWDFALSAFQYLLIQTSSLLLLFTVFYFYKPTRSLQIILLAFMVLNPLFLYIGNLVSSDALFLALSLIWFALLLWITHRPSFRLLIWHTVVVYFAFTVRYNAMIYVPIAALAFTLSSFSIRMKLVGIGMAIIVIGLFVLHTGNQYKVLTGSWQYSPFSGWQLTNNAMYAYRYVDSAHRKPVPGKFKELDKFVTQYFDSTRDTAKYPQEAMIASTVYMWDPRMPPYKYRQWFFRKDTMAPELKRWASMGPLYKDYGMFIIKRYPLEFIQYFLWPNSQKYYAPPVEFLEQYNSGKNSVPSIAQKWFHYKTPLLTIRTKDPKARLLDFYPILSGVINVIMLFGLLSFFLLGGFGQNTLFRKAILLSGATWLLNAGFTIFASSAALRFQSFPIMLSTVFAGLLLNWIWKLASAQTERIYTSSEGIILST
ncbi:hypothetical protein A3860_17035 [Niastella vici]|uniref:Glycosyltransferase RgtA/B/C/D-like domain-containing protein n=1 Tax=Niastella vici TaxID=1703345 RepID=A0A1V9G411_9BACT|nr:hypothetical protein [Niastella vici]OQP65371.1 hypothetical protein A3860_17035 [Niastella vici]